MAAEDLDAQLVAFPMLAQVLGAAGDNSTAFKQELLELQRAAARHRPKGAHPPASKMLKR